MAYAPDALCHSEEHAPNSPTNAHALTLDPGSHSHQLMVICEIETLDIVGNKCTMLRHMFASIKRIRNHDIFAFVNQLINKTLPRVAIDLYHG